MNRIKEVLEKKGIKQVWLSDQLGKSYNMVNSYVQNRRQPSLEVLNKIAGILDIDVMDLMVSNKIDINKSSLEKNTTIRLEIKSDMNKKINLLKNYDRKVPHIIKYMGSKRRILDFVIKSINDNYTGGMICDLFAGTSVLSGALGKLIQVHSNDIQQYSAILSKTYLSDYHWDSYNPNLLDKIIEEATVYVDEIKKRYTDLAFSYEEEMRIAEFVEVEESQQALIHLNFENSSHHLFIKYYSGTYWSFEQCLWIDALRRVADTYRDSPVYYVILSSLMYGMSYCSQSTGHYAQYRDAKTESSKDDILTYRIREILPYFKSKFKQLKSHLGENKYNHTVTSLDYRTCLDTIAERTIVYADPPYAFVHYSRFYHALETLVKYDYPEVDHKGRYRSDRHQSPFGRTKEVKEAFTSLFEKIKVKQATLILSYSNTGMITLKEILKIAAKTMHKEYNITYREEEHIHSTMGRSDDKSKDVKEYLIIAKPLHNG